MDYLTNLPKYEWLIYLLSAFGTLLFALVLFSLLQRSISPQEKRWANPFADTFWMLAVLYFVLLILYGTYGTKPKPNDPVNFILHSSIFCFSAVTNYLFIISGSRLWEPTLLLDKQRLINFRKWSIRSGHLKLALIISLCLSVLLQIANLAGLIGKWAKYPDDILSFVALIYMGVALYLNSRSRREKLLAWEKLISLLGLLASIGYAVIYLLWGSGLLDKFVWRILPQETPERVELIASLLLSLLSLPFKFWIFYAGYSLLLLISGPLQGIETLLNNITQGEKEFLDSDGILKSVWEEVRTERVRLYIKLPGSEENLIELYEYTPALDGEPQEPRRFAFEEEELYAKVMKSGLTKLKAPLESSKWAIRKLSKIGVPVFFHNSVIACLEVSIGEGKFTKADRIKLERIATLISPALQTYRELSAINKITDDAGRLQIGVKKYELERDVDEIAKITHNVISPLSTGISIESGFKGYSYTYPEDGPLEELTKNQLKAKDDDEVVEDLRFKHRWLKKELKFRAEEVGEQVLGKFIFATDKESRRRTHPTLGTNESSLHAISDLTTDTLLDFTRGRLNQLTDLLGTRLSSFGVKTPLDWSIEVATTAKEAGLGWAVASYPDGEGTLFGDDSVVELVKRLEQPAERSKWKEMKDGFWLYSLDAPEAGTYHVIKKSLMETLKDPNDPPATLWLGVEREGFGPELEYTSPWEFFLYHFCEIAGSALHRLQTIEEQKKRMGEVHSIVAGTLIVGQVIHYLKSVGRSLLGTAHMLVNPNGDKNTRATLLSEFREQCEEFNSTLPKLSYIKSDLRQPCPLNEVVQRAVERVKSFSRKLEKLDWQINYYVPPGLLVNVPFDAAANTLAVVIENAKDAIEPILKSNGRGLIGISVEQTEDKIICHVTDNGPGVPPEIQKKLLKEVSKTKTKTNSQGVGLLFSLYLLRLYNGDIALTKAGPDPNTTFSIYFPK